MDLRAPAFFLAEILSGGRATGTRGADGPPSTARNRDHRPHSRQRIRPC